MDFDRLAPFYLMLERCLAGRTLQRCRTAFLQRIPVPSKVLLAGEGPGRFLVPCALRFPAAEIVVVDGSAAMLREARHRLRQAGCESPRIRLIHADLLEWEGPPETFDLLVTNFVLDCLEREQIARLVRRLGEVAAPEAQWLLAEFHLPQRVPARWRSAAVLHLLYWFFRWAARIPVRALVPADEWLRAVGFAQIGEKTWDWGLLKSQWWQRRPAAGQAPNCAS